MRAVGVVKAQSSSNALPFLELVRVDYVDSSVVNSDDGMPVSCSSITDAVLTQEHATAAGPSPLREGLTDWALPFPGSIQSGYRLTTDRPAVGLAAKLSAARRAWDHHQVRSVPRLLEGAFPISCDTQEFALCLLWVWLMS